MKILRFDETESTLVGTMIKRKLIHTYNLEEGEEPVHLKPLFVFDLKDVYVNCFIILFFICMQKNNEKLKNTKLKNIKAFSLMKINK